MEKAAKQFFLHILCLYLLAFSATWIETFFEKQLGLKLHTNVYVVKS